MKLVSNYHNFLKVGDIGTVEESDNLNPYLSIDRLPEKSTTCVCGSEDSLELITNKNNIPTMDTLIKAWKNLTVTEPNKSRRAAGITDENDVLTSDGESLYLNYLLQNDDGQFDTKVVQPIVAAKEAEKKA